MMPIHELLSKIRWDREFRKGKFEIGYYDRVEDSIITIPLEEINFPEEDHFSFELVDSEGEVHSIPFHRIKSVYKEGELIWHREH